MCHVVGYHVLFAGVIPAFLLAEMRSRNPTFQKLSNQRFSALLFKPKKFEVQAGLCNGTSRPQLEYASSNGQYVKTAKRIGDKES